SLRRRVRLLLRGQSLPNLSQHDGASTCTARSTQTTAVFALLFFVFTSQVSLRFVAVNPENTIAVKRLLSSVLLRLRASTPQRSPARSCLLSLFAAGILQPFLQKHPVEHKDTCAIQW